LAGQSRAQTLRLQIELLPRQFSELRWAAAHFSPNQRTKAAGLVRLELDADLPQVDFTWSTPRGSPHAASPRLVVDALIASLRDALR
jgi:hypothetical protein